MPRSFLGSETPCEPGPYYFLLQNSGRQGSALTWGMWGAGNPCPPAGWTPGERFWAGPTLSPYLRERGFLTPQET